MPWEIEIADVVAGQPIESTWGNAIRDRVVHRLATVAMLPTVSDGGVAYTEDTDQLWLRRAGAWVPLALNAGLSDTGNDRNGFTNTAYADLNALTGGTGTMGSIAVSLPTGTSAAVSISCAAYNNTAGIVLLGYRVSGATTAAASDSITARNAGTTLLAGAYTHVRTGLTPGTNVFTLQAKVTAGAGRLITPSILVTAL